MNMDIFKLYKWLKRTPNTGFCLLADKLRRIIE